MAEDNSKSKKATVPYVPFKTFTNTLDSLAGEMMPDTIDPSLWQSYSGGVRSQLMGAFKFFKLINDEGEPSAEFKKLATDKESRPQTMREILKRSYGDLMKLDLTKVTPKTFDDELRKYGLDGETHRKAIAFFLSAAKFAGVPLSTHLLKRGFMASIRPKKAKKKEPISGSFGHVPRTIFKDDEPAGHSRSFQLPAGTVVTIGTSADAFHMPSADRKIVFDLLEKLEQYGEVDAGGEDEDEQNATGTVLS